MTDILWPLATVVVALLVWDALRKWLSRDDLVKRVDTVERRCDDHVDSLEEQVQKLKKLTDRVSEAERVATGTRDKVLAENAARVNRQPATMPAWGGFDRPKR